ncbi:RloB family protein [Lunatimonas salinarum]|uniref:RloB family protein n=1 Tax=Lunatimonas salinarum TaxID=1774590 RepID=UPI001AE0C908|nr:RloB family protein [Lunatimonas salinarum]
MPKKTRATKVTDGRKAWNRKSKPTAYRVESIPINRTILIVCEGQTEAFYFRSFPVYGVKAEGLGYQVAYSNDAFELWFFLHFEYTDAAHLRTFYYKALGEKFGLNYEKEGKRYAFCQRLYSLLTEIDGSSQEKALDRARILFENKKELPYHLQNPVTKVFELVEELNKNLRR